MSEIINTKKWPAVMLDLETMGNSPRSPIVSIGAVPFDPIGNEPLETLPSFYCNVSLEDCIKCGLAADGSTIMWWLKQDEAARNALFSPAPLRLEQALGDFFSWFKLTGAEDIWAHATFDPVVIRSAADAVSLELPWKHRNVRDIRTLVNLAQWFGYKTPASGADNSNKDIPHKADDDARYQVAYVRKMYQAVLGDARKAA